MKIIITESQLLEIERTFSRDRFDAPYAKEYPKYKDMFFTAIKMEITASGETEDRIMLGDSDGNILVNYRKGSRTLYYDYKWVDGIEKLIPWHLYARHFKYALAEYFNSLFPNVSIKDVTGAHIG
jgi:hypothetical protein